MYFIQMSSSATRAVRTVRWPSEAMASLQRCLRRGSLFIQSNELDDSNLTINYYVLNAINIQDVRENIPFDGGIGIY